ncbi:hypothetical protein ISG33_10455 [Glaciecola sp. MH2013]|uniref:hypothetical protein n=1 Tax=Glaciecola sp. MH2013 TaxID=2785524 RepID=UPI00189DBDD1|nr:hypothetical protein [Glaciecola sp. MH2013]MBF7073819.1 hypothetical protein [Glaciecola sp. MH2013]
MNLQTNQYKARSSVAFILQVSCLLYLSASIALAQEARTASDCVAIKNDEKRLYCFDQVFSSLSNTKPELTITSPELDKREKVQLSKKALVDSFGSPSPQKSAADELQTIALTLSKVSLTAKKRQVFTFANGQIWESKTNKKLRIKEGDSAIITKGALSAFYLSKKDVRGRIRVKRRE